MCNLIQWILDSPILLVSESASLLPYKDPTINFSVLLCRESTIYINHIFARAAAL